MCVSIMLYVYSVTGVPLTTSNVMIVVKKVEKWWGYMSLSYCLNIPESKQEEIRARFQDEEDQKRETVSYWINTDPLASWRRLITALDEIEETELADSIRSNAEPLTGTLLFWFIYT